MTFYDIVNNVRTIPGWAGATIATNTDTTSTIVIDSQGFEAVAFAVHVGAITDGSYTLKILETNNSDGTTGAAEVGSYQYQGVLTKTPDDSNTVDKVGAKLTKRYCTLRITSTGATTGAVFKSGIAILSGARNNPVGL